MRMRMSHEVIGTDFIDLELIELKYNYDRRTYLSLWNCFCGLTLAARSTQITSTIATLALYRTTNQTSSLRSTTRLNCSKSHKAYVSLSFIPPATTTLLICSITQLNWLFVFLKIYIRALQQGSDLSDVVEEKLLIGDRPKPSSNAENKKPLEQRLVERSEEERAEVGCVHYCINDLSHVMFLPSSPRPNQPSTITALLSQTGWDLIMTSAAPLLLRF
jgi:hypothetical protein